LVMLQSFAIFFSIRILGIIVVSALPFFFMFHAKFRISLWAVFMQAYFVWNRTGSVGNGMVSP
jgi:uncharacterized protein (DUF983 family)